MHCAVLLLQLLLLQQNASDTSDTPCVVQVAVLSVPLSIAFMSDAATSSYDAAPRRGKAGCSAAATVTMPLMELLASAAMPPVRLLERGWCKSSTQELG